MPQLLAGPVVAVDGQVLDWQDVVAHARRTGTWDEQAQAAREGLACAAAFAAAPDPDLEAAIDAAGDEFRYDRDLLTAAEMEAWLGARGVTTREWMESIERATLRDRWADRLDQLLAAHPASDAAVEAALLADLRCSDGHTRLAEACAADAAAAAAQGEALALADAEDADARAARLVQAADAFRAAHATPEALAREVAAHRLEWLRIEGVRVTFPDEPQAREAALCVREDGLELVEVADSAGVDAYEIVAYLDDVEPELHDRFLATGPGGIVGPLAEGGGYVLFQLTAKVVPSADDPDLAARAHDAIAARAVAIEVERRVRWVGVEAAPA